MKQSKHFLYVQFAIKMQELLLIGVGVKMTSEEAKQALKEELIKLHKRRRLEYLEEKPPMNTPANGWFLGYFDALEEVVEILDDK